MAVLTILLGGFAVECGRDTDHKLDSIAQIIETNPDRALAKLKDIDSEDLTEAEGYYLALLTVKAQDKAFIRHMSDSLILKAIDYYKSNDTFLLPEALYYGGRVYSDLGDYPAALKYFHESLERIPHSDSNMKLRATISSQTGWLLDKLRMHSQAVEQYKEALRLDSILNDTTGWTIDIEMIAKAYMSQEKYDSAELMLRKIQRIGNRLSQSEHAQIRMMYAGIKLNQGKADSALFYIRGILGDIHKLSRSEALAYAGEIYLRNGILDTAYNCARTLAFDSTSDNRKTGFRLLLSLELLPFSPKDSIPMYYSMYSRVMNEFLDRHDCDQTLLQNSEFNYRLHEKARLEAERKSLEMSNKLKVAAIVILILTLIIVIAKSRCKSRALALYGELYRLIKPLDKSAGEEQRITTHNRQEYLRNEIIENLMDIQRKSDVASSVPCQILESDAYASVMEYLEAEKKILDSSHLWKDLERIVYVAYPLLKNRLMLLASPSLKRQDLQIILLIKCGITPTQLTILLGKAKGTISSRRTAISERLFNQKLSNKVTDELIRLL